MRLPELIADLARDLEAEKAAKPETQSPLPACPPEKPRIEGFVKAAANQAKVPLAILI